MSEISLLSGLDPSWQLHLQASFTTPWFARLEAFLQAETLRGATVYPEPERIFSALNATPFPKVRAVILGQDPYHGPGQAQGLSFSVPKGIPKPPSLVNIHREYHTDLGLPVPSHGSLEAWAQAGVLLLNTCLTVRAGEPMSHQKQGWEQLTGRIVELLAARLEPMVFILWGASAHKKAEHVDLSRHGVIRSPHPSPLSSYRGFFGSRPFSQTNEFLVRQNLSPIDWLLPD